MLAVNFISDYFVDIKALQINNSFLVFSAVTDNCMVNLTGVCEAVKRVAVWNRSDQHEGGSSFTN